MKISCLVASRKNSKYLAKFLFGAFARTDSFYDTEFLVMANQEDTWNQELFQFFDGQPGVQFFFENKGLGRSGLHEYFNELYKHATGDWIVYFCEDHFIVLNNWDTYIRRHIYNNQLNPKEPFILVPKFDNAGTMNHILSRGYCEAVGGVIGRHGWIDSYINEVIKEVWPGHHPKRVIKNLDADLFHDFTHDKPSPMDDAHLQSVLSEEGIKLPKYTAGVVKDLIRDDAKKIQEYLNRG